MQKNRFQLVLIVLLTLLSAWFLFPTFQDASHTAKLKSFSSPEDSLAYVRENRKSIDKAQEKRLKLGLDLQGGMHVVLEVDVLELLENRARNRDAQFDSVMAIVRERAKKRKWRNPQDACRRVPKATNPPLALLLRNSR
jgi:preprotein translocase subunit SecD